MDITDEKNLPSIRHPENSPRKVKPNIDLPNTCVARWHKIGNKRGQNTVRKLHKTPETSRSRVQSKEEKVLILPQRNNLVGT